MSKQETDSPTNKFIVSFNILFIFAHSAEVGQELAIK